MKEVKENLEQYIGKEYKIIKGHATGWGYAHDLNFDTFYINPDGDFCNEDYMVAFSPDTEVECISDKEVNWQDALEAWTNGRDIWCNYVNKYGTPTTVLFNDSHNGQLNIDDTSSSQIINLKMIEEGHWFIK